VGSLGMKSHSNSVFATDFDVDSRFPQKTTISVNDALHLPPFSLLLVAFTLTDGMTLTEFRSTSIEISNLFLSSIFVVVMRHLTISSWVH
jgi:hypothetical protein